DGNTLAIAVGEYVRLYDVGTGKEARRLRSVYRDVGNCFLSLAFTPDSKGLAVSETVSKLNYTTLSVCAVATGKCQLRRKETAHSFVHLPYSPDGKDLATAERRHVVILDAATLKDRPSRPGPGGIFPAGFTADGKSLVCSGGDFADVCVYDGLIGLFR